jgi:hypothetical protein
MVDSRLGASFSVILPLVVAILSIWVTGAPNTLKMTALVPELEIPELSDSIAIAKNAAFNLFGNLTMYLHTAAFAGALNGETCASITQHPKSSKSSKLDCMLSTEDSSSTNMNGMVLCTTTVFCKAENDISGAPELLFKLPSAFQKIKWSVQPGAPWNHVQTNITGVLASTTQSPQQSPQLLMSGTVDAPSMLDVSVQRGKLTNRSGDPEFGLQFTWRGADVQESNGAQEDNYFHYVGFRFAVSENVLEIEERDEKTVQDLVTAVLVSR